MRSRTLPALIFLSAAMRLILRQVVIFLAIVISHRNVVSDHASPPEEIPQELKIWLQPQDWQRDTDGPVLSLGETGTFDDTHVFAPSVAMLDGTYYLWYSGSTGAVADRVFRLGLATGIANGRMTVMRQASAHPTELRIHFHGAPKTVRSAFARSQRNAVLAVVNFPGLSTACSGPFAADPGLFQQIQTQAWEAAGLPANQSREWSHVTLPSFSAGYGAVRELLKTPPNIQRINAIVTADSVHAGLPQQVPDREVQGQGGTRVSGFEFP